MGVEILAYLIPGIAWYRFDGCGDTGISHTWNSMVQVGIVAYLIPGIAWYRFEEL